MVDGRRTVRDYLPSTELQPTCDQEAGPLAMHNFAALLKKAVSSPLAIVLTKNCAARRGHGDEMHRHDNYK